MIRDSDGNTYDHCSYVNQPGDRCKVGPTRVYEIMPGFRMATCEGHGDMVSEHLRNARKAVK